jgi:ubiquinone/menaquinone biosynthesis C-methylase UbiE
MSKGYETHSQRLLTEIRTYWDSHIHDLEIAQHPVGTAGFFNDLAEYRYDKLRYLQKVVKFSAYQGKRLLEIGCGLGLDLLLFARGGAKVTGVDFSKTAIGLAKKNFKCQNVKADLREMNGEMLDFPDDYFDLVYAHGVLQYTANAQRMVDEAYRVLKPGGEFISMVYNRKSWLNVMSKFFHVELEHEDAPILKKFTIGEFKKMLSSFSEVNIVPERFPVKSRLQKGIKGFLFNTFFVGLFNLIPKAFVRSTGWHLMAFAIK